MISSVASKTPAWLTHLLGIAPMIDGDTNKVSGRRIKMVRGIIRSEELVSAAQEQTRDAFAYKWAKRDTFEGEVARALRDWLIEKYGNVSAAPWWTEYGESPILLDAGCGAGMSGMALFGPILDRIRYLGADVSTAVDIAKQRFEEHGLAAGFLQADLLQLPIPEQSVDIVFSEGVLHHTDDTKAALMAVSRYLKTGGRMLFYVYRKKGPIREFTDDLIRDKLQAMSPEEGWRAIMPLTMLGKLLGELKIEVDVPEAIDVLGIPAGRINLQRLVYWHIFKIYYRPEMTLNEMNHINFDWYAPKNAHRHTPEEVREWCGECGLQIEHEKVEDAGITIIAKKIV